MLQKSIRTLRTKIHAKLANLIYKTISTPIETPLSSFQEAEKRLRQEKELIEVGALATTIQIIYAFAAHNREIAAAYAEVATFVLNIGLPELAQKYFKFSLAEKLDANVYSQYIQCLLLSPSCTDETMFEAATQYNKHFLSTIKPKTTHDNERDPNKILHVGYLCHFFYNSVSQSLLIPFLRAHNRDRIKIYCYSDSEPHEVPPEIKNIADVWHDTKHLDDSALSKLLQKDKIDVVVEMNGHCHLNRYRTISEKPVPVQISFYNHCATTGIPTFDYNLLGDEITIHNKAAYVENVFIMQGVCGVAIFPDSFPKPAPSPHLKNGYITFGSFGAAHKVNIGVIKVWCQLLKRLPNARLYMKAGVLTHSNYLNAYKQMFKNEGIDLARIDFEGHSPHQEMLECYAKMDIGLDSFPHAAGTTTMEASWMGVPVITLREKRFCSQNGSAILSSIGHAELIADSVEEYINKAIALAADSDRLVKYRNELRSDFKNSPRADAKAYATKLEDAYTTMWQTYCQQPMSQAIS